MTIEIGAGEYAAGCRWDLGQQLALEFTTAGNFQLREIGTNAILWETATKGEKLAMQRDGNLVIYAPGAKPVWSSGTDGNPAAVLRASEEGELMISSSDGKPLWQAGPARSQNLAPQEASAAGELQPPEESRATAAEEYQRFIESLSPRVRSHD